jgi:hemoglobin-like flavoprotein
MEVGRPDAQTIEIARESCAAVADRPAQLAECFYEHLFELAPQVRAMFPADMSIQHERMSRTLVDAVRAADDPAAVERLLQRMGAAHGRNHSVVAEHYPYVGRALVRAVRDLSPGWSTAVGSAWVQVYEWMAAHMVLGAENSAAHTEPRVTPGDPKAVPALPRPTGSFHGETLSDVSAQRFRALSPRR